MRALKPTERLGKCSKEPRAPEPAEKKMGECLGELDLDPVPTGRSGGSVRSLLDTVPTERLLSPLDTAFEDGVLATTNVYSSQSNDTSVASKTSWQA